MMKTATLFMSRNRLSLLLAACAVFVASILVAGPQSTSPTDPATSMSSPRIAVEPPSFDFGKLLPDKAVSRTFLIRNFGSQDLTIENISTSCGCTLTEPPAEKVLKPGKSAPFRVTLTTNPKPGVMEKSVMVRSNDPARALFEIKLKATVVAPAAN
jgi:hypothetical protein